MTADEQKRMQELCTAIAQEQDTGTLLCLVAELNQLFDRKEQRLKQKQRLSSQLASNSDPRPSESRVES